MKGTMERRLTLGMAAALLGLLVLASVAWACGYQPRLRLEPPFGTPKGQRTTAGELSFTVVGDQFYPGEPVQIRWNSPGGELVGIGYGPEFNVPVTVPEGLSPGVYYVVAKAATVAVSESYEVTAGSSRPENSNWNPQAKEAGRGSAHLGGPEPEGDAVPRPQQWAPVDDRREEQGEPANSTLGSTEVAKATGPSGPADAPVNSAASRAASSAGADSLTVVNGRPVFAPSVAPPIETLLRSRNARSVLGDAWSGFGEEGMGASVVPGVNGPTEESGAPGALVAGTLFLGGLLVMFGGFVVTETRRRRSTRVL